MTTRITKLRSLACSAALAFAMAQTAFGADAPKHSPLLQYDFPFTKACISANWPEKNIAYKGIAIRHGDKASICFDTDLLRWSAGWTDGFISDEGVAFNGNHGGHPVAQGDVVFGTRQAPGWADANGEFKDSRSPEPYGPLPYSQARWGGINVSGDQVVLTYNVLGAKIEDQPTFQEVDGTSVFIRTIRFTGSGGGLRTVISDSTEAAVAGSNGTLTFSAAGGKKVTVAILGSANGVKLSDENGRITAKLPSGNGSVTIALWRGDAALAGKLAAVKSGIIDYQKGGKAHWPEPVVTKGVIGTGKGPFVVDNLTPPVNNPWNRRVRFGGLDFFKDGKRAALCTWDGDIWIVSGIDEKLENLSWRRFASGGYETLGLKIVNDVIYTSGRDEITRYTDVNGDGEADYYENFNNQITSSTGFHEFVFDLQTDADGNFYFTKAGPVRGGGRGFGGGGGNGEITEYAGSLLKVSKDGSQLRRMATGFRAPNGIGVSPNGDVTTGDNEGTWVPACPINWVRPGGFYGVEDTAHAKPVPYYDKPICWLSHGEYDNSGGGQVWVTGGKWPFQGRLLHMSYGQCALYLVLPQQISGGLQGGVVKIPANFTSSAMRGKFSPADGQLYITGLQGWQTKAAKIAGLDRVRYTGKSVDTVVNLAVDTAGVHLTFSDELDRKEAEDLQNWSAKRWNYLYSSDYGSPDVYPDDKTKRGREEVKITSAKLSPDGRTVTLQVKDLKPVMQMQTAFVLKTKEGREIDQNILQTIHTIPPAAAATK